METPPKTSLALQFGYASWGGPVLGGIVSSMTAQKMDVAGPYVKVGVGLLMLGFFLFGICSGVAGRYRSVAPTAARRLRSPTAAA